VIAIDNAGTVELAIVNSLTYGAFDEGLLISTTAEGGVGGADSGTVIYSTSARTNVPFRVVGYVYSTQATAGSWATAPSNIAVSGANAAVTADTATSASNVIGASQTWQVVTRVSNTWYQNTTARAIEVHARYDSFSSGVDFFVNATTPDFTGAVEISFSDADGGDSGDYGIIIVPIGSYYTCNNWGTARELR
jgi:hypothetical protein